MSAINQLLERAQPGASLSVKRHIRRGKRIHTAIESRYGVTLRQWKQKHLIWFLDHCTKDLSRSTRYDYYRTMMVLSAALCKQWKFPGTWSRPTGSSGTRGIGGRPQKLSRPRF